jgi:hypothetical protein
VSDPRFVRPTSPWLAVARVAHAPGVCEEGRRCLRRCFPRSRRRHSRNTNTRDRSAVGLRAANNADARGHHVVQHQAVLSAVQGSARCAAHAH